MEEPIATRNNLSLKHGIVILLWLLICLMYLLVSFDDYSTYKTETFDDTDVLPEILSSDEYLQTIRCDRAGLSQISLLFSTFDRVKISDNAFIVVFRYGKPDKSHVYFVELVII